MASFQDSPVRFETVPLRIQVGEREFIDNDELVVPDLLAAMAAEKAAASTACPSPAAFAKAFEAGDCTVCFTISANLSGTYNAAMMARDMVLEEHPEKKICVIDSKATAGAMALLIHRAIALMKDAAEEAFEDICDQLRLYQAALRTCFTLENFDNLIKNGRMRPLVGNLLHSLGIHVIADATPQGTIHVADKARGEAKTCKAIAALMGASKDCTGARVVISHCENLPGALKLKQTIQEALPVKSVDIISCRGLTSFYAMEKGLIIGY
jgi:DegV family protein with EDD domain